ncbi:uncharacterized protein LOC106152773 [Lingula anatina]|uniref:Uncharacterized protein LOC106152773 n=1 Tax=Lingula anatina TaxID=7574 RepID=A0A1S3H754_LINAN|nr:uncharacterized protein LOC106152773 [Lingula anatina]|eukprot:XP_013381955.1 uncharacterized protein LOC106152773 [Lingula anatina]
MAKAMATAVELMIFILLLSFGGQSHGRPYQPLSCSKNDDQIVITGGPMKLVFNIHTWQMTLDSNSQRILTSVDQHWGVLGVTTWTGIDIRIYNGYSWRLTQEIERFVAQELLSWTLSQDKTQVTMKISSNSIKGYIFHVTVGNFTLSQIGLKVELFEKDGSRIVPEPRNPACLDDAKAAGDIVYDLLLKNRTAEDICEQVKFCQKNSTRTVQCQLCVGAVDKAGQLILEFIPNPKQNLEETFMSTCELTGQLRIDLGFQARDKNEGFYGFGVRYNAVNQRGKSLYSWAEDGGWSLRVAPKERLPTLNPTETYAPMPFFISAYGYGMYLNTTFRSTWDMCETHRNDYLINVENTVFDLTIYIGRPSDILSIHSYFAGRAPVPPPFQFGPWLTAADALRISGPNRTIRAAEILRLRDIPFTIEYDEIRFFPLGEQRGHESEILATNKALRDLGIYALAYYNSMLVTDYSPLYNEAVANNYLVKFRNNTYTFTFKTKTTRVLKVGLLDFTAPGAVDWFGKQLQVALNLGFVGFMVDYGENVDPECSFSNGMTGREMHNLYPVLYQTAVKTILNRLSNESNFRALPPGYYAPPYTPFFRSGYLGSGAATWAHWTGDPMCDWSQDSGLPAQVHAMLSGSLSGIPYIGSDIGGFVWIEPPSMELWIRWTQVGTFSGLMRSQQGGSSLSGKPKTQIFDWPEGEFAWRKQSKLRMALFPYIYKAAHFVQDGGIPIMRHHILSFPNDPVAISHDEQFMFGDAFLVAPVLKERAISQIVYLPREPPIGMSKTEWIDFNYAIYDNATNGRFRIGTGPFLDCGQTKLVSAPLETIPLFVKAGSAIPTLDPSVMTLENHAVSLTSPPNSINPLHWWVWPNSTYAASGELWDQSLVSMVPTSDPFNKTRVSARVHITDTVGRLMILQIAVNAQSAMVTGEGTDTFVHVKNWDMLVNTDVDKDPKCAFSYDTAQHVLWVRVSTHCNETGPPPVWREFDVLFVL